MEKSVLQVARYGLYPEEVTSNIMVMPLRGKAKNVTFLGSEACGVDRDHGLQNVAG